MEGLKLVGAGFLGAVFAIVLTYVIGSAALFWSVVVLGFALAVALAVVWAFRIPLADLFD